jgi:hypothetical protein
MRDRLVLYFGLHGQQVPDDARLYCLARIGVGTMDKLGVQMTPTAYLVLASFLAPAYFDPKHRGHEEVRKGVDDCVDKIAAAGPAPPENVPHSHCVDLPAAIVNQLR